MYVHIMRKRHNEKSGLPWLTILHDRKKTFQLSKFLSFACLLFAIFYLLISFSSISVAFCPDMNFCHIHSWVDKHASREEAFAGSTATGPQCLYPDPPPGDPPSSFPAWNTCFPDRKRRSKNMTTQTTIPEPRIRNWIPEFPSTAITITLTSFNAKMVFVVITTGSMKSKPWQVLTSRHLVTFVNPKIIDQFVLSFKHIYTIVNNAILRDFVLQTFYFLFASGFKWFLTDRLTTIFRGNDVEPNQ